MIDWPDLEDSTILAWFLVSILCVFGSGLALGLWLGKVFL
jgi:hypothetical protein